MKQTGKLTLNAKDRGAVEVFCRRVQKQLGPNLSRLALFGSKATGKDTPESDIDILVLVKELSVPLKDEILDIAFDVNLEHNVYISPRVIGLPVFNDPLWSTTPFLKNLKATGIIL